MLKEEYKLPAGVYKVKTFRTTQTFDNNSNPLHDFEE